MNEPSTTEQPAISDVLRLIHDFELHKYVFWKYQDWHDDDSIRFFVSVPWEAESHEITKRNIEDLRRFLQATGDAKSGCLAFYQQEEVRRR